MIFLMILMALGILVGLWAISKYNSLIHVRAMAKEAWSGIDVQLKRRYDLIPNLVETVKGYSGHEKGIFDEIARMRAASMGATDIHAKETAEIGLNRSLKSLFALVENYPNLKANENFMALQKELSSIEQELQLARRYYNGTVRNYTVITTQFPSNIVASIGGFESMPYFEVIDEQERSAPKVKF